MAYTNKPHTGWKLDTTEGVETTLVAADFIGDWDADEIQQDLNIIPLMVPGTLGPAKHYRGSSKGTLAGFEMPVSNLKEKDILQLVSDYALVTGTTTMNVGGQVYSKTGATASRISTKTISLNQYNAYKLLKLLKAKPTRIVISGKNNEHVKLSADFAGVYSAATAAGYTLSQVPATVAPNTFNGSTITLDAVAMACSEVSIDFGIEYVDVADGSTDGFGMGEVVNITPKITINPLAVADATYNFYSKYNLGSTVTFVWTFGSGVGNTYTITATGVIESLKGNLDNNVQRKEIVLSIQNSAQNNGIRIVNV